MDISLQQDIILCYKYIIPFINGIAVKETLIYHVYLHTNGKAYFLNGWYIILIPNSATQLQPTLMTKDMQCKPQSTGYDEYVISYVISPIQNYVLRWILMQRNKTIACVLIYHKSYHTKCMQLIIQVTNCSGSWLWFN